MHSTLVTPSGSPASPLLLSREAEQSRSRVAGFRCSEPGPRGCRVGGPIHPSERHPDRRGIQAGVLTALSLLASAVDLPGRRLARPQRVRLARGGVAAGGRAGTRPRRRRVRRGDGRSGRPAPEGGSGLPPPGRRALDGIRAALDLFAIYRVIRLGGGPVKFAQEELAALPPSHRSLFDKQDPHRDDNAVLIHPA